MPNPNKITNCLPVILLKINEYGVTATTMIRKSKTLNIVTSQTERRIVNTAVAQVITVIAVKTWRLYDVDNMSWCHRNVVSMLYRLCMLAGNSTKEAVLKINNSVS